MTATAILPPPRELAHDRRARSLWIALERGDDLRPWIQAGVPLSVIRKVDRMREALRAATRLKVAGDRAGVGFLDALGGGGGGGGVLGGALGDVLGTGLSAWNTYNAAEVAGKQAKYGAAVAGSQAQAATAQAQAGAVGAQANAQAEASKAESYKWAYIGGAVVVVVGVGGTLYYLSSRRK